MTTLLSRHATDQLTHAERIEVEQAVDGPITAQHVADKIRCRTSIHNRKAIIAAIQFKQERLMWLRDQAQKRVDDGNTQGAATFMLAMQCEMNAIAELDDQLAAMSEQQLAAE